MSSRTTSSAWVKGVVEMFDNAGLNTSAILALADIDGAILQELDARVATEKVSRLWRAAAEVSGDPAVSLVSAHVPRPGNFDIVGYAMLSSRSLRMALQAFSRHLRLVSDAAEMSLEDIGENVRVHFKLFGGREPIPRQRMEFDLLTILTFCRWVSGRQIKPLGLMLVWPAPDQVQPYAESFQCPLHAEADFNGLVFAAADLDAPLPTFNPLVAGLHEDLILQRLAVFDGSSLSIKVRDEIARLLAEGEPRRERVAQALNLSDRTLQRRLREENASFDKLLDATRCDLAQHYLAQPGLSLAEVAYLLGFADQSAFFRACKRWFDASPRQFRARIAGAPTKTPPIHDGV